MLMTNVRLWLSLRERNEIRDRHKSFESIIIAFKILNKYSQMLIGAG